MIKRKRKRRTACVSSGRHLSCRKQATGFNKLGLKNKKLGVKGSRIFSLLTPYFLLLTIFSGCIVPIPIFVPGGVPEIRTGNPRQGVWVTETGHVWLWNVDDRPEIVRAACAGYDGCVKWVPGNRIGEIYLLDSNRIALHECAHALGFSLAMTAAEIEAELHHLKEMPASISLWRDGPARQEPCGPSAIYTGVAGFGSERGGRLLPLCRGCDEAEWWRWELPR
jgi:hypothetical protein